MMRLRRGACGCLVAVAAGLLGAELLAAQQLTPIKDILANPSAYHRQAVVLQGTVRGAGPIRGQNAWGQHLCGQEFMLQDESGQLPVMHLVACQPGHEREWMVRQGETVTIEATMDAAPSNMKTITGRGLGVSAVAQKVIRDDHGGTRISIDSIR